MKEALQNVADFHAALGARIAASPTLLAAAPAAATEIASSLRALSQECAEIGCTAGLLFARLAMALEELAEWTEAHATGDLIAAADAWGDRLYVLLGDAVATGLPGEAVFNEIHRSNMTKTQRPADRAGKAQKDDSFQPPRLDRLLGHSEAGGNLHS